MNRDRSILLAAALCASVAWAGSTVEGGKVYSGPEGIEVSVVTVAPRSKNQAVILVKGTDSELDGKALLHTVDGQGDRIDYRTKWHGRDYVTIAVRSSYGSRSFILGVPGRRDDIQLSYDDKKTKELKAEEVYSLYEKQNKDGSLNALQGFDRKGEETRHDKDFVASVDSMNKACGTKVSGNIDWKSVTDDLIKSYSISSYCANPLSALEKLCASADAKTEIQAKVKKYSCSFGKAMTLEVKGGNVTFVTEKDAGNQEEFATKYFEKNL